MKLDLEDPDIYCTITGKSGGRTRLVLEYPTEKYRAVVLNALIEMLRPAPAQPPKPRGRPKKERGEG